MNLSDRETLLDFCLGRLSENAAAAFARRVADNAELARLVDDLRREIAEVGAGRFIENSFLFQKKTGISLPPADDAPEKVREEQKNGAVLKNDDEKIGPSSPSSPISNDAERERSIIVEKKSNENTKKRQKRRFAFVPKRVVAPRRPDANSFLAKKASLSAKKKPIVPSAWLADCRKLFFPPSATFEVRSIWSGVELFGASNHSPTLEFSEHWTKSGKRGVSEVLTAQTARFSQSFGAFVSLDEPLDDGETFASGASFEGGKSAISLRVDAETAFELDAVDVFARLTISNVAAVELEPSRTFGASFGRSNLSPFGASASVDAFSANENCAFVEYFVSARGDGKAFGELGAFELETKIDPETAFFLTDDIAESAPILPRPIQSSKSFAFGTIADGDAARPEYPTFLEDSNGKFAKNGDFNALRSSECDAESNGAFEGVSENSSIANLETSQSDFAPENAAFVPQKSGGYFAVETEPEDDEIAPTISAEDRRLAELLGRAPSKFEQDEYYWEPIGESDGEVDSFCEKKSSPFWRAAELAGIVATAPAVAVGRATLEIFGYYRAKNLGRDGEFNRVDSPRRTPEPANAARSSGGFSETAISVVAGMLIAIFIVFPLLKIGVVELFEVVVKSKARSIGQNFTLTNESSEVDLLPFLSEQFLFPSYESVEMRNPDEISDALADLPTESESVGPVSDLSSGAFDAAPILDVSETSVQIEAVAPKTRLE